MGMKNNQYNVRLTKQFTKEFKKVSKKDPQNARRITKYIKERIIGTTDPYALAESLTNNEADVRYRVGDYRLIAKIKHDEVIIEFIKVGHRRDIYKR